MSSHSFDFEKQIVELEQQLDELRAKLDGRNARMRQYIESARALRWVMGRRKSSQDEPEGSATVTPEDGAAMPTADAPVPEDAPAAEIQEGSVPAEAGEIAANAPAPESGVEADERSEQESESEPEPELIRPEMEETSPRLDLTGAEEIFTPEPEGETEAEPVRAEAEDAGDEAPEQPAGEKGAEEVPEEQRSRAIQLVLSTRESVNGLRKRIRDLEAHIERTRRSVYSALNPWQRIQIARHPDRPRALDYIRRLVTDWTEVRGDRCFGDDSAVLAGFGRLHERPVAVIGQQKGVDTKDNIARNFGMMHPEGYRKALRVMKTAEKFRMPILVFIDTSGAYPGIGAEERGQGEAIGRNIMEMSMLRVPIVCSVIGEGASGGALGIGVGDRVLMMEYAWYCVISPEGCSTILWRDASRAEAAAEALRLTAADLTEFGVVDEIIPEPLGGAHHDPMTATDSVRAAVERHLEELDRIEIDALLESRFERYRKMGNAWLTVESR